MLYVKKDLSELACNFPKRNMDVQDICAQIENDEFYSKFLGDTVKPVVSQNLSVTDQVNKLNEGINQLNTQLEKQVLLKHNDLLAQANHVTDLENALARVHIQVQTLMTGAEKLKAKVNVPYNALETNALALENVQKTCHLLRHIGKILLLFKTLNKVNKDHLKEALILNELKDYINDYDLSGIDFIADKLLKIDLKQKELLQNTSLDLEKYLLSNEKKKLLECFKVFQNLQSTNEQIEKIVSDLLQNLKSWIVNALNIQVPQESKKSSSRHGPGKVNIITAQEFKTKLWENVDRIFANEIREGCTKIIMLQSVLNELLTIGNFNIMSKKFWEDFLQIFSSEVLKSPSAVNECFETDFPKLLKCFNDLINKLKHKDFVLKRELLSKWENAFLSKSLSKLLENVRGIWMLGLTPSTDSLDSCIRAISTSLSVSLGDKQLSISLGQSVAKCIKQMNAEAEQRLSVDGDLAQIIEAPTSSQQKNAELCNALHYFSSQIKRVLNNMNSSLPQESIKIVEDSLKMITSKPVLQPIAVSICRSLDIILLTMYEEPDLARGDDPTGKTLTCSAYMKELQQFVIRCRDIYLSMFDDILAVEECCAEIASHCIERFLWLLCNIRPLTKFGRVKLSLDCQRLESALLPLISDLNKLGDHIRWLKALQVILGMSTTQIANSQKEGGALPHSLVAMYLFSFASKDLVSPGAAAGWDTPKLINWLDAHKSEKERLDLVSGALKRYQNHIRTSNITEYDPVYPIILQLLEDGKSNLMSKKI